MNFFSALLFLAFSCWEASGETHDEYGHPPRGKFHGTSQAGIKNEKRPEKSLCSTAKFEKMDRCCMVPAGPLFTSDVLDGRNGWHKKFSMWANSLIIHRAISKKTGRLDLKTKQTTAKLCAVAPIMDCLYQNESMFLNSSSSFYNATMKFFAMERFMESHDPWFDVFYSLIEPFKHYKSMNEVVKPEFHSVTCKGRGALSSGVETNILPILLTQYFQNQIIALCPEPELSEDDKCDRDHAIHNSCTDSLNKMLFTEEFYKYTDAAMLKARGVLSISTPMNFQTFSALLEVDNDVAEWIEEIGNVEEDEKLTL